MLLLALLFSVAHTLAEREKWEQSPLYRHVHRFAELDGAITPASIRKGHEAVHYGTSWLSPMEKIAIHAKTDVILDVLNQRGLPHHIDSFFGFVNPARTGFWNPDGTFNQSTWNLFVERHASGDSITKHAFEDYLGERYKQPELQNTVGTAVSRWYGLSISSSDVTTGSVNDMFKTYVSNKEEASVEYLQQWYEKHLVY
jgi:hypothetical protein